MNLHTLQHLNTGSGATLSYYDVRLQYIAVISALTTRNITGVNGFRDCVACDGKILTWLNKPQRIVCYPPNVILSLKYTIWYSITFGYVFLQFSNPQHARIYMTYAKNYVFCNVYPHMHILPYIKYFEQYIKYIIVCNKYFKFTALPWSVLCPFVHKRPHFLILLSTPSLVITLCTH